jgi:HAD superfamily hydrolase (TIGR01549 family)
MSSTMNKNKRPTLRGVVFDMDDTLAVSSLDVAAMHQRCGVGVDEDLLKIVAEMPPEQAAQKAQIMEKMEEDARKNLQPMPGARELVAWLAAHEIATALVTRNTMKTALVFNDILHPKHKFDIVIGRDSESLPSKPDPALFHHVAEKWGMEPADMLMVGDSPANDIEFGKAAGAFTVLLDAERTYLQPGKSTTIADIVISELAQLPKQIWAHFDIPGNLGTNTTLKKYSVPKPSSPVTRAAVEGELSVLQSTTAKDLWVADDTGNNALIWAADAGQVASVEYLLKQLVNDDKGGINARGFLGATALCRAARLGHVHILKLLVQAGADMDIPNDKLQYPLHFAAFKQNEKAVEFLLESGANTLSLDRKGRVPAEDTKCEKIRELILAAMA